MTGSAAVSSKLSQSTHFYFEPDQLEGDTCQFGREESDHILKAFRLYIGDMLLATDGCGNLYSMQIAAYENKHVRARVVKVSRRINELPFELTVGFGVPQQSKADQIIDQCTQLGATAFLPILSKNSPGKLTREKSRERVERWRKVAISSMKQSLRSALPAIQEPADVEEAVATFGKFEAILIGSLKGAMFNPEITASSKRILLLTGPEEGFSRIEEDTFIRAGARPVLLGERRLRAELAPIVLATLVGLGR
jgi:16S rRNA (uracil1498-N3)-methyltransferase